MEWLQPRRCGVSVKSLHEVWTSRIRLHLNRGCRSRLLIQKALRWLPSRSFTHTRPFECVKRHSCTVISYVSALIRACMWSCVCSTRKGSIMAAHCVTEASYSGLAARAHADLEISFDAFCFIFNLFFSFRRGCDFFRVWQVHYWIKNTLFCSRRLVFFFVAGGKKVKLKA